MEDLKYWVLCFAFGFLFGIIAGLDTKQDIKAKKKPKIDVIVTITNGKADTTYIYKFKD